MPKLEATRAEDRALTRVLIVYLRQKRTKQLPPPLNAASPIAVGFSRDCTIEIRGMKLTVT
jgi:hypothetical protein